MAMVTKKEIIFYICIFVQFLYWISVFFYGDRDFTGKQWIPLNALFAGLHYQSKEVRNHNKYQWNISNASYYSFNTPLKSNLETAIQHNTTSTEAPITSIFTLKIILMWNAWDLKMADEPLVKAQCPIKSCLFTTDMSLIHKSDVIVLHFDTLEDFPLNRQSHQRYVFYHFESPINTALDMLDNPRFRYDYFNWTMTYRRDSDIFLRDYYGSLVAKTSIHNDTPAARYNYDSKYINDSLHIDQTDMIAAGKELSQKQLDLTKFIKGKTKMITWFVGHCSTPIRREEYVHQLSQYVPIDVYGDCTRKCPSQCDEMLRSHYKFYLAFENSWCPDYVTEKFIRPYLYEAIPILLGGADYSKFAPPSSYINARDFDSPKQLAEYLLLIDQSDSLYASYFSWKKDYYVSVPDMFGWCELCRMSHDNNLPPKVYPDIKKWWMSDAGECEPDSTKYF